MSDSALSNCYNFTMSNTKFKESLDKTISFLKDELTQIRTGRATPAVLDSIRVDAYGSKMSLRELGNITVPDPSTLIVTPWDKSLLNTIAQAIRESSLRLEPIVEGDRVRLVFPGLTEERRQEFARLVGEKVEACRQRIRKIRQEEMKKIDTQFESKEIDEDSKYRLREEVDTLVKDANADVEALADQKIKEIMTV